MSNYLIKVEVFLLSNINEIFIHRLNSVDMCFEKFTKTLAERYKMLTKSNYIMTWIDAEDDLIRIFNEKDFMLFVELKGSKIYVINESIWDEWNDRHTPQNGNNIQDIYSDLTAAAETTSHLDALLDVASNAKEPTEILPHEIEETNARANPESDVLLDVVENVEETVEQRDNEIETTNPRANFNVPEPAPELIALMDVASKKPIQKLANEVEITDARTNCKEPESATNSIFLLDIVGNDNKPVEKRASVTKMTSPKTNVKVPEPVPELVVSSEVTRNEEEPKEKLTIHSSNIFKFPEAIAEFALQVSAKSNLSQMESILAKLPIVLTKRTASGKFKSKGRKKCKECGLFRSSTSIQNLNSTLRLPHLKGRTCSTCGRNKRNEVRVEGENVTMPSSIPQFNLTTANHFEKSETDVGNVPSDFTFTLCIDCKLYKSKTANFYSGRSIVLRNIEGTTCPTCGGPELQPKISDVAELTFTQISKDAAVCTGDREDVGPNSKPVLPETNLMEPQTESQLQKNNFVSSSTSVSVSNQQNGTGTIPKTSNRLYFKINEAINSIMGMGYKNDDGRITRLVESVNGDVIEALELLHLLDKV